MQRASSLVADALAEEFEDDDGDDDDGFDDGAEERVDIGHVLEHDV
jgi:hypothetical protein